MKTTKKQLIKKVILIDGDNHIREGEKGIHNIPKNQAVDNRIKSEAGQRYSNIRIEEEDFDCEDMEPGIVKRILGHSLRSDVTEYYYAHPEFSDFENEIRKLTFS